MFFFKVIYKKVFKVVFLLLKTVNILRVLAINLHNWRFGSLKQKHLKTGFNQHCCLYTKLKKKKLRKNFFEE